MRRRRPRIAAALILPGRGSNFLLNERICPRVALSPACACRVPESTQATATFLAKAPGVLAGVWVAHAVFARVDPAVSLNWLRKDGEAVQPGQILGEARGSARCGGGLRQAACLTMLPATVVAGRLESASQHWEATCPPMPHFASLCLTAPLRRHRRRSILIAERVALNFMQRMSGIASLARQMVVAVQVGGLLGMGGRATWGLECGCSTAGRNHLAVRLPGMLTGG